MKQPHSVWFSANGSQPRRGCGLSSISDFGFVKKWLSGSWSDSHQPNEKSKMMGKVWWRMRDIGDCGNEKEEEDGEEWWEENTFLILFEVGNEILWIGLKCKKGQKVGWVRIFSIKQFVEEFKCGMVKYDVEIICELDWNGSARILLIKQTIE
jgi:hypothetical protein